MNTSGTGRSSRCSSSVMSPRLGTVGYRSLRSAQGKGSISENHKGFQPRGCHATEGASMPLQTLA